MTHTERLAIPITWEEGDTVEARGKQGIVHYVYTNGYTLVCFAGIPVKGNLFSNDSTFGNEEITTTKEDLC